MSGTLYLVSTPIGNPADITLRALTVLQSVDLVVCEELKEGRKLLKYYQIEKPLETLNEHNEEKQSPEIFKRLNKGEKVALIADCGTPAIANPGAILVNACLRMGVKIVPLPGASSLTAALSVSGLRLHRFFFVGFLPPKTAERRQELSRLKKISQPLVIMEAPYRMIPLLKDIVLTMGKQKEIIMTFNLTLPDEEIMSGPADKILRHFQSKGKGEFVIIIPPPDKPGE